MASLPIRLGSRGEVMRGWRRPGETPGHCWLVASREALSGVFIAARRPLVNPAHALVRENAVIGMASRRRAPVDDRLFRRQTQHGKALQEMRGQLQQRGRREARMAFGELAARPAHDAVGLLRFARALF